MGNYLLMMGTLVLTKALGATSSILPSICQALPEAVQALHLFFHSHIESPPHEGAEIAIVILLSALSIIRLDF